MNKSEAYQIVFDDLKQLDLFNGIYDAEHGKKEYMYGIIAVMEQIASGVSEECCIEFSDKFFDNMCQSLNKVKTL